MAAMFFVVTMALYFAATVSFLIYLLWPSEVLGKRFAGYDSNWVCRTYHHVGRRDGWGDRHLVAWIP